MANRKRNIQMKFYVTEDEKTAHRRKNEPVTDTQIWRLPPKDGD